MTTFSATKLASCLLVVVSIRSSLAVQAKLRVADNMSRALTIQEGFSTEAKSKCVPAGTLKFAHVMKSGGLSVDAYLGCRCASEGCSISRHEGGDGVIGESECGGPSVCTSHQPPFRMWEECAKDANFSSGRIFTVLRDPIERVLSFFNYMKYPRPEDHYPGYPPYKTRSLKEVLLSWSVVDLNINQPRTVAEGGCVMCAQQLSNAMVLRHFATNASMTAQESWTLTAGVRRPATPADMMFQLEQAKNTLSKMDAVFMSMSTFKEAFEKQDLLNPDGNAVSTSCDVPVVNPTGTKEEATAEELDLIKTLNWADIELYKFAQTLPNTRK